MNKRSFHRVFYLSALGIGAALFYMGSTTLLATQALNSDWHLQTPNELRPMPIAFVNGSFETPVMHSGMQPSGGHWAYVPAMNHPGVLEGDITEYVHGWNSIPLYAAGASAPYVNCIEMQKPISGYAPDGNQYVEVNVDGRMYLSQTFATTPGSRLYYSFEHKSRGNLHERMGFVLKDANLPLDSADNLLELNAGADWMQYVGRYDVPQGQYRTEIGFRSLNDDGEGNLLDHVEVKTGAYLEVAKSSDRDSVGSVRGGETITYRIRVQNYGEISATQVKLRDKIDSNVEYIGGARVNGVAIPSHFDEQQGIVEMDLDEMVVGAIGSESQIMEISYQTRAKEVPQSQYSVLHQSQSTISYKDRGYDTFQGSTEEFVAHSNLYQLAIVRDLLTTEIGVSLGFEHTNYSEIPANVRAGLFRDNTLFMEVDLNESNHYSHIFSDLEYEYLREVQNLGGSTPISGQDPQNMPATNSNAGIQYEPAMYQYDIRLLSGLDGFQVRSVQSNAPYFIFMARYLYPSSPGIPSTPSGNGGNSDAAGTGNHTREGRDGRGLESRSGVSEETTASAANISIATKLSDDSRPGVEGAKLRYEITVRNESDRAVKGIWIRDYFSEYCSFVEVDPWGSYGIIGEQEFANWFLEELDANEEKTFYLVLMQDFCLPDDSSNEVKYIITNEENRPWTNDKNGP